MREILRICQQNLSWRNEKIEELVDTLLHKEPQVLLFSEFCYSTYTPKEEQKAYEVHHKDKIVKRLRDEGYDFYWPYACKDSERPEYLKNCQKGLICAMAVKKEIRFHQRERKDITVNARYIEGELILENKGSIEILFVYVPQAYNNNREKEKKNMLEQARCFWNDNKDKKAFIGGDFNTEINGKTSCEDTFKSLYRDAKDTANHEPTWKDRCLDYALVSKSLYDCGCKTELLETTSDHKALLTEITMNREEV